MFGTMATMPFVHSPPRFGSRDIGPIIPVGGIGRMDTGDTDRGLLSHSRPRSRGWVFFSEAARLLVGIAPEKMALCAPKGLLRVSLDIVGEEIGWKKPSRRLNVAAKPLSVENSGLIPGSKWQNAWRAFVSLYSGTDVKELALAEGLRAAVGIAIPIAIGLLANHLVWGILCAFATLWILMCDVGGAYRQKAINLAAIRLKQSSAPSSSAAG